MTRTASSTWDLTQKHIASKLSVQLFNDMQRRKQKYGVVTMCVGTEQEGCLGVRTLELMDRAIAHGSSAFAKASADEGAAHVVELLN